MDWVQLGADAAKGRSGGKHRSGHRHRARRRRRRGARPRAPELGRWLFGPGSAATVQAVQTAVQAVTGATQPDAQVSALANPEVAKELRIQLASIAAERAANAAQAAQDQLLAQLAGRLERPRHPRCSWRRAARPWRGAPPSSASSCSSRSGG